MGFIEANRRGFSRIFDFSGRATRAEFWWFTCTGGLVVSLFFSFLILIPALNAIAESMLGFDRYVELFTSSSPSELPDNLQYRLYSALASLGFFPIYVVTIRRFHDIGEPGSWILFYPLSAFIQIPIVNFLLGLLALYFLGFKRGDAYTNKFGPGPISFDEHSSSHESIASQIGVPADSETDAKFYQQALAELESGKRDSGIWAKAYAEAHDEGSSKRLYVKLRAEALMRGADFYTGTEQKKSIEAQKAIIPPKKVIAPLSKAEEALLILNQTKYDSTSVKKSVSKENKISSMSFSENVINQKHFAEAIKEIETDKRKDGLWAMAYATNESEEAAKKKYINLRAEELHQEELAQAEQEAKEKKLLREKQAKEDKLLKEIKAEEERKIINKLPDLTSWAYQNNFVIQGGKHEDGFSPWKIRKLPFGDFEEFEDDLSFVRHLDDLRKNNTKYNSKK